MKVRNWKRAAIAMTLGTLISCIPGKVFADEFFVEDEFFAEDIEEGEEFLELETEGVFGEPEFLEDEEDAIFEDEEFEIDAELITEEVDEELLVSAEGDNQCGDNVFWTFDGFTLTISGTGPLWDYPHKEEESPFSCRNDIQVVKINEGVTSIGNDAFSDCYSLTSITIPDSVTSIGRCAFFCCENLTSITIPNSVTSIRDKTFMHCSDLTKIMIPDSVTSIGVDAFYGCNNLKIYANPGSYAETYADLNLIPFHKHEYNDWATKTAATCTTDGVKTRKCINDDCDYLDIGTIPAKGHTYDDWVTTKDATCTTAGQKTRRCTSCDYLDIGIIPAKGHKPVKDPAVAATATSEGKTEGSHCSVCGAVLVAQQTIPKEKITVTKKPSIKKPVATKNKITVKWSHFKHTSKKTKKIWKPIKKVQVQCATDKAFKNIVKTTMVKKSKTKAVIKSLKKNTTYYVRVRYYDGTGYSNWSKVKKVKTKKK